MRCVACARYFVDVFARSPVGVFLYAHGSMLADNTPPLVTGLLDAGGSSFDAFDAVLGVSYDASLHVLVLTWAEHTSVSGPVTYGWHIGLLEGLANIHGPVNAGAALTHTATVVLPPSPNPYYVSLATLKAGCADVDDVSCWELSTSVPLLVDSQGPLFGWVIDGGGGTDQRFTASTSTLDCQWGGFLDPVSGIAGYYIAAGTDVGRPDVAPFEFVGPTDDLAKNFTGLSLSPSARYYDWRSLVYVPRVFTHAVSWSVQVLLRCKSG